MPANVGTARGYLDIDITKFSQGLVEAVALADSQGAKLEASLGKKMQGVGNKMQTVGKSMSMYVTAPIAAAGAAAIKVTADFDEGMSKVQALSGATGQELDSLRDKAKEMGAKTKFSATESAEAFQYMALAGWKTGDMLNGIEGIMNLAAASGENLGSVSDIVTDSLTAFGMKAEDSAHFADVLAAAMSNSNTDVAGLGEAFKYVGPVAGAFGYTVEDVSIALGTMANAGIKGSSMGTALRQSLVQLTSPTESAAAYMEKFGISLYDSQGETKDLMTVMQDLRSTFGQTAKEALAGAGDLGELQEAIENNEDAWYEYADSLGLPADAQEKLTAITDIFGARSMPAMLSIINASDEDFQKLTNSIYGASDAFDGAGTAAGMSQTMMDNLNGQITIIKSTLEGFAISIGEILMPYLRKFASGLQSLLDRFNSLSREQKEQIVKWALVAAAIGPVLAILGKVITIYGKFISKISGALSVLRSFSAAMKAVKTEQAAAGASAVTFGSQVEGAAKKTGLMTKATSLLKGGLAALGITAAIALVGMIVQAYADWKAHVDMVKNATDGLKGAMSAADSAYANYASSSQQAVSANQNVAKSADEALQAQSDLASKMKEQWQEVGTNAAMVDGYAKTIDELGNKGSLTAEEQARLNDAVKNFNEMTGNSIAIVNSQTGELNKNKQEIKELTEAYKEQARVEAAKEMLVDLNKQMIQDERALDQAKQALTASEEKYQQALQDYPDAAFAYVQQVADNQRRVDELSAALESAEQTQNDYMQIIAGSAKQYDTAKAALDDLKISTKDLGGATEENLQKMEQAFDGSLNSILQSCVDQGLKIPKSLADAIGDNSGLPEDQQQAMIDAMVLQMTNGDVNAAAEALGHDLDDGLVAGIEGSADMPASAVGVMSEEVINRAREAFQSHSPSQVFNELGVGVDEGLAEGIEGTQSAPVEAMQAVADAIIEIITGLSEEAPTYGETLGTSFAESITGQAEAMYNAGVSLGEQTKSGLSAGMQGIDAIFDLSSLVSKAQSYGQQFNSMLSGMTSQAVQGATQMAQQMHQQVSQAFSDMNSTATSGGQQLVSSVQSTAQSMVSGMESGLSSLSSTVSSAMSSAISTVSGYSGSAYSSGYSIGSQISSGVSAGVSAGGGSIASSLISACQGAISEAKASIQSSSPSRLTKKKLGIPMVQGVAVGIQSQSKLVTQALSKTVTNATSKASSKLGKGVKKKLAKATESAMQGAVKNVANSYAKIFKGIDKSLDKTFKKITKKYAKNNAKLVKQESALQKRLAKVQKQYSSLGNAAKGKDTYDKQINKRLKSIKKLQKALAVANKLGDKEEAKRIKVQIKAQKNAISKRVKALRTSLKKQIELTKKAISKNQNAQIASDSKYVQALKAAERKRYKQLQKQAKSKDKTTAANAKKELKALKKAQGTEDNFLMKSAQKQLNNLKKKKKVSAAFEAEYWLKVSKLFKKGSDAYNLAIKKSTDKSKKIHEAAVKKNAKTIPATAKKTTNKEIVYMKVFAKKTAEELTAELGKFNDQIVLFCRKAVRTTFSGRQDITAGMTKQIKGMAFNVAKSLAGSYKGIDKGLNKTLNGIVKKYGKAGAKLQKQESKLQKKLAALEKKRANISNDKEIKKRTKNVDKLQKQLEKARKKGDKKDIKRINAQIKAEQKAIAKREKVLKASYDKQIKTTRKQLSKVHSQQIKADVNLLKATRKAEAKKEKQLQKQAKSSDKKVASNAKAELKKLKQAKKNETKTLMDSAQKQLDERKKTSYVSATYEAQYWTQVAKLFKKGSSGYKQAMQKANAAKKRINEEYNQNIVSSAENTWEAYSRTHDVTLENEIKFWQDVLKTMRKGTATYNDTVQRIKELQWELYNNTVETAEDTWSKYAATHTTTYKDEIDFWKKVVATCIKGTQEYADAVQKLNELQFSAWQSWKEENDTIWSNFAASNDTTLEQELAFYKKLLKQVKDTSLDVYKEISQHIAELEYEIYNELNTKAEEAWSHWSATHDASIADEIAYWRKHLTTLKTGTNAYSEVLNKIAELEWQQYNELNATAEEEWSHYAATHETTLEEEIAFWNKHLQTLRKGTNAYKEIVWKLEELQYEFNKQQSEFVLDYQVQFEEVQKALKEGIVDILKSYDEAIADTTKSVAQGLDLYTRFDTSTKHTTKSLLRNLKSQTAALKEWNTSMERLAARGASQDMLKEIEEKGVESLADVRLLLKMSDEQWSEYLAEYERKMKEANKTALRTTDKEEYVKQLQELVEDAHKSYQEIVEETNKSLAEAGKSVMIQAPEIGKNMVNGIISGYQGEYPQLQNYLKSSMAQILADAKKELGISSPSKKFAQGVGKWIPLGIEEGFMQQIPGVAQAMRAEMSSITFEDEDFGLKVMIQTLTINLAKVVSLFRDADSNLYDSIDSLTQGFDMFDVAALESVARATEASSGGMFELLSNVPTQRKSERLTTPLEGQQVKQGDTFIFNSPDPIDEVEAARQMKRAKRQLAEMV